VSAFCRRAVSSSRKFLRNPPSPRTVRSWWYGPPDIDGDPGGQREGLGRPLVRTWPGTRWGEPGFGGAGNRAVGHFFRLSEPPCPPAVKQSGARGLQTQQPASGGTGPGSARSGEDRNGFLELLITH